MCVIVAALMVTLQDWRPIAPPTSALSTACSGLLPRRRIRGQLSLEHRRALGRFGGAARAQARPSAGSAGSGMAAGTGAAGAEAPEAGADPRGLAPQLKDELGDPREVVLGLDVTLRQLHAHGVHFELVTGKDGLAIAADMDAGDGGAAGAATLPGKKGKAKKGKSKGKTKGKGKVKKKGGAKKKKK
eukprot:g3706.t1